MERPLGGVTPEGLAAAEAGEALAADAEALATTSPPSTPAAKRRGRPPKAVATDIPVALVSPLGQRGGLEAATQQPASSAGEAVVDAVAAARALPVAVVPDAAVKAEEKALQDLCLGLVRASPANRELIRGIFRGHGASCLGELKPAAYADVRAKLGVLVA